MASIALCFYGQPRFINNPEIARSYHKYFFSNPAYQVDCYGHLWYSNDATYESTSWVNEMPKYDASGDTLKTLYDNYNFKRLIVEEPREFRLINESMRSRYEEICKDTPIQINDVRENNTLSHLYSKSTVLKNVPNDYDFYVSCRYDTVVTDVPDLNNIPINKMILPNKHPNFCDPIMIFGKNFLTWGRSLYSITQSELFEEARNHGFFPEVFKMYSYYRMGFTKEEIVYSDLFAHIQRSE